MRLSQLVLVSSNFFASRELTTEILLYSQAWLYCTRTVPYRTHTHPEKKREIVNVAQINGQGNFLFNFCSKENLGLLGPCNVDLCLLRPSRFTSANIQVTHLLLVSLKKKKMEWQNGSVTSCHIRTFLNFVVRNRCRSCYLHILWSMMICSTYIATNPVGMRYSIFS